MNERLDELVRGPMVAKLRYAAKKAGQDGSWAGSALLAQAADEMERLRVIAAAAVRAVSNPAWAGVCDEDVDLERALVDAGLMEGKREIHYGCHCDLEPGMNPDGCVIDEGMLQECTLAIGLVGRGKDKWSCPHWRPAWNRRAT